MRTVVDGCAVVTMDAGRTEHAVGHVVVDGSRIASVGEGRAPRDLPDATYVDGTGCLATPGLVNTHHHLYQWLTRGSAVDHTLFEWLTTLYPVWAGLDEDTVRVGATGALVQLARTGCTTTTDHHYVFPADGGDLLAAEIEAARAVGLRFLPTRGSMDLGRSRGGLPPDHVVEEVDAILVATADAIDRHHDPSPDSMLRVGVAPCSPFSVTGDLLRQAAALARDKGVRLHTHLAETIDEEDFCREMFGLRTVDYLDSVGWLSSRTWLGHGIHFDDAEIARLGAAGTGVAHCPSSNMRLASGIARTVELEAAGVPVGIGVDGSASNDASNMILEARQALYLQRLKYGAEQVTPERALGWATAGSARVLGRDDVGTIAVGQQADLALFTLDDLRFSGSHDPLSALLLCGADRADRVMVAGQWRVIDGAVVGLDLPELISAHRSAAARLVGSTP